MDWPSTDEWNDWQWQLANCYRNLGQIETVMKLTGDERESLLNHEAMLPTCITPYYMLLALQSDAIRKCVIPTSNEFFAGDGETDDPLDETKDSPIHGLIHRYPDRVALIVTTTCANYCRYCTRSRMAGRGVSANLEEAFNYIIRTPEVRDVLITGGDPLILPDEKLEYILTRLHSIPHVEFIRIGTKVPAVLPQRVTKGLCEILREHHPWLSLHFTHPDECTLETKVACNMLADAGCPLGSQTVLLKGINDNVDTLKSLFHKLLVMRVRPYYLYQCDPITGSAHFRTSVAKGLEMIEGLRGWTSGYAVPTYVIDAPDGGGKIPMQPNYISGREGDDLVLRNYQQKILYYPDPLKDNHVDNS
jgi:lysine 2,3-aminomutase